MKIKKRVFSLVIVLALLLCLSPSAFAIVSQSKSFYVADYANVLSDSTEQMIINYNGALEQQCQGAQIVVVTVDYLDGMYSDEYAYELFNDWGVGSSDYDNGMLLLLAVQENKAWLAYGLGLNSGIDDDDVESMMEEYFWTDFDKARYDSAVTKLFSALLSWYDGVYGSQVSSAATSGSYGSYNYTPQQNSSYGEYESYYSIGDIIRTIVVILLVMSLFSGGRIRGGSWLPWLLFFNSRPHGGGWDHHNSHHSGGYGGNGFGGGGFSGGGGFGGGSGFGGGMGHGGGGFSGGGGGRR